MNEPRVLLFRGRGLISALIRWQTRSEFSHAAILLPNGTLIEAWPGPGVHTKTITDWEGIESFTVSGVTPAQWMRAIDFCYEQVGCKYDYLGVLRFLNRADGGSRNRWFCSELVFAALDHAGIKLLNRVHAWAVSPGALGTSPKLVPFT